MASFLSRILSWFRSIGNRTLCCPILSIIILVINKSDSDSVNYSYDYRPNWTPLGPITIIYIFLGFLLKDFREPIAQHGSQ